MTIPQTADESPWTPTWKPLSPEQRRVLGVLIEKAKTTPATYPMTINAIVLGSNQKNNREPVMALAADDVERVLEELRVLGAVTEAPEATRAAKFRHRGYEWLGVERAELAVMTELLLRGAQTLGDLRSRADRMEHIPDLAALKPIVDALVKRGLMVELTPPGRGQLVSHNLYGEQELADLRAGYGGHAPAATSRDPGAPATAAPGGTADMLARLAGEVTELRAEVARLSERLGQIESKLTPG
ncbi:MAG TPA: DUF480 domain-containing protein [Candidatus Eisenbacteria bacterium]|jgi:hypothetical protein